MEKAWPAARLEITKIIVMAYRYGNHVWTAAPGANQSSVPRRLHLGGHLLAVFRHKVLVLQRLLGRDATSRIVDEHGLRMLAFAHAERSLFPYIKQVQARWLKVRHHLLRLDARPLRERALVIGKRGDARPVRFVGGTEQSAKSAGGCGSSGQART